MLARGRLAGSGNGPQTAPIDRTYRSSRYCPASSRLHFPPTTSTSSSASRSSSTSQPKIWEEVLADACRILRPGGSMFHAIDLYIDDDRSMGFTAPHRPRPGVPRPGRSPSARVERGTTHRLGSDLQDPVCLELRRPPLRPISPLARTARPEIGFSERQYQVRAEPNSGAARPGTHTRLNTAVCHSAPMNS